MFDPHRIGPRRSSSYSRNKGRVIQRRAVNTPSPGYTRTELEQLVPVMKKNGFIPDVPPPPSPDFGRVVSYSVLLNGVDVTNDYDEFTSVTGGIASSTLYVGYYLYIMPNWTNSGVTGNYMAVKAVYNANYKSYTLEGVTNGTRLYFLGPDSTVVGLLLYGENGTVVNVGVVPSNVVEETDGIIEFSDDLTLFPM